MKDFTFEDALSLTTPFKYYWGKYNLIVLRDGYLPNGTRIHVVAEQDYHIPVMLGNALVISEDFKYFL